MIAHPSDTSKLPNTAAILQLNCRRSHNVTYSLFNDHNIFNFLFVALKEPPVNAHTNQPSSHAGWQLLICQPVENQGKSWPRSCIYINTRLSPAIQPIYHPSRDISACIVTLQKTDILVVNVYNQPSMFLGFQALESLLRTIPTSLLLLPAIIVADSNLHSPIWNPGTYSVHDPDAEPMVEVMTNWNFHLRSPKGIPTYEAKPGMTSGVTIDLVWVNQQANEALVACLVDAKNEFNHHSDHHALVTVVGLNCDDELCPGMDPSPEKAWHKVDQATFIIELKARLSTPHLPCSTADIVSLDLHISDSVIYALNSSSPNKIKNHKHKAWWNPVIRDPL